MDHQLREAWTPRAIYSIPPAIGASEELNLKAIQDEPLLCRNWSVVTARNVQNNPGIHESLRIDYVWICTWHWKSLCLDPLLKSCKNFHFSWANSIKFHYDPIDEESDPPGQHTGVTQRHQLETSHCMRCSPATETRMQSLQRGSTWKNRRYRGMWTWWNLQFSCLLLTRFSGTISLTIQLKLQLCGKVSAVLEKASNSKTQVQSKHISPPRLQVLAAKSWANHQGSFSINIPPRREQMSDRTLASNAVLRLSASFSAIITLLFNSGKLSTPRCEDLKPPWVSSG